MRKAQVENGVVTNVILVDPDSIPDWCADWPDATDDAEVGGTYTDGVFARRIPTPEEVAAALEAARAGMTLTFAQLLIGLVTEAWITEAEGEAWLTGTLPAAVLSLISTLPAGQQFAAKARAIAPSVVLRVDPLVAALGSAQGKTPEQIDAFFTTYAGV